VQRTISKGRLNLNFQKHPNQIKTTEAGATQFTQLVTQRIVTLLAFTESALRRRAGIAMQLHTIHK